MSRYVTIRLTLAQAQAACNAADLIRDQYEAGNDMREAAMYARTSDAIEAAIKQQTAPRPRRARPNIFDDLFARTR